jgi:transcriptional regulator with XRE-family HTH domain
MSNVIFDLRNRLNFSQAGLARHLGISRQMVWRYERGDIKPSYEAMEKIIELAKKNGIEMTVDLIMSSYSQ